MKRIFTSYKQTFQVLTIKFPSIDASICVKFPANPEISSMMLGISKWDSSVEVIRSPSQTSFHKKSSYDLLYSSGNYSQNNYNWLLAVSAIEEIQSAFNKNYISGWNRQKKCMHNIEYIGFKLFSVGQMTNTLTSY